MQDVDNFCGFLFFMLKFLIYFILIKIYFF